MFLVMIVPNTVAHFRVLIKDFHETELCIVPVFFIVNYDWLISPSNVDFFWHPLPI